MFYKLVTIFSQVFVNIFAMEVLAMGKFECTTEDIIAATKCYETYMSLRWQLRNGQLEREDFEDYMSYKEKQLTKCQVEIMGIMIDSVLEEG